MRQKTKVNWIATKIPPSPQPHFTISCEVVFLDALASLGSMLESEWVSG